MLLVLSHEIPHLKSEGYDPCRQAERAGVKLDTWKAKTHAKREAWFTGAIPAGHAQRVSLVI